MNSKSKTSPSLNDWDNSAIEVLKFVIEKTEVQEPDIAKIYTGKFELTELLDDLYKKSCFYRGICNPRTYRITEVGLRTYNRLISELLPEKKEHLLKNILACPFCGRIPNLTKGQEESFLGGVRTKINLECCITMTQDYGQGGVFYSSPGSCNTEEQALDSIINRWNRRSNS